MHYHDGVLVPKVNFNVNFNRHIVRWAKTMKGIQVEIEPGPIEGKTEVLPQLNRSFYHNSNQLI